MVENQPKPFVVVITGARSWFHAGYAKIIKKRLSALPKNTILIHGGCRGVDRLSGKIASDLGFAVRVFHADWDQYGPAAGPMRNRLMLNQNPDLVIAFHHDIEKSSGTKDCYKEAVRRGIAAEIIVGPYPIAKML